MTSPGPLRELLTFFRKHNKIPTDWITRLSPTGDLDEAARRAWQTEPDPRPMLRMAAYWVDRKTLGLVALDLGRMLLPYLPKKHTVPKQALDFLESWATQPNVPEPKNGWLALADSIGLAGGNDDSLPHIAAHSITTALTVPDYPHAAMTLANAVISRKTDELIQAGGRKRRSEAQVDALHARAESELLPVMVAHVRARIPAPAGAVLRDVLERLRAKELAHAMETKRAAELKAFRPD